MIHSLRSVVTVNALVFAGIGIGFLNNALIAAVFGLTVRVDAFFAASMLPALFMILCVDYLGKNFMPVFAVAKRESNASASRMTSTVITIVTLLALAVSIVLAVFSEPVFNVLLPGFEASEAEIVSRYFWIMAPAIVLMAVTTFHEYVCQYEEKFAAIVTIRMAQPLANLLAIVMLGPLVGEYCLPLGYLAGHAVVFLFMARKATYKFVPSLAIRSHLERQIFVNSAILMSTGFLARSRSLVMNALASTLGSGAISALALTQKLTAPLERGAFTGARMFMFSRTARMFAENNERDLGHLYAGGLKVAFLLLAPLLWWIGLNSTDIVRAVFGRGEFTPEMTLLVAGTLVGMIPSVLFLGVNQLLANAFYATNRVKAPALIMPLGMLVYIPAAIPLARIFGTPGLAIATTVSAVFVFVALLVWLSRVLEDLDLWRTSLHLVAYSVLSGAVMTAVTATLGGLDLPSAAVAIASLPIGTALYLGVLGLVRDRTCLGVHRFARDWLLTARAPA
jgi:putative peptidoglycan lipid II flippase